MKRVLAPEKEYSSLKPVFGQKGAAPPFYDPYDAHLHIWVDGILKSEEDHTNMYFSKKTDSELTRCTYCSICHEKKQSIKKINNEVHFSDKLFPIIKEENEDSYILENKFNYIDKYLENNNENYVKRDLTENKTDFKKYKSIFLPNSGIYNDYLVVDD